MNNLIKVKKSVWVKKEHLKKDTDSNETEGVQQIRRNIRAFEARNKKIDRQTQIDRARRNGFYYK